MYSTEPKGADWKLHQCLLNLPPSVSRMASGVCEAIGLVARRSRLAMCEITYGMIEVCSYALTVLEN